MSKKTGSNAYPCLSYDQWEKFGNILYRRNVRWALLLRIKQREKE
ncbi:MAG: hypothetical protein PVG39_01400 [Desulfobacteraceae bacterium]|jgi:hypothetical protein